MIESRVSARRYLKAMFAATERAECLGLVLVVGRPSEVGRVWPEEDGSLLRDALGPYLGLARAVPPGREGPGVVLPEGIRVVAEGLDAHHWPGSESAFRRELGVPAPESWDRTPRRDVNRPDSAAWRVNTAIARYFDLADRDTPAVVVLDPVARRGTVATLRRGATVRAYCERLVAELGGWPRRRLAVVESLVDAHLEHAALLRPDARAVVDQLVGPVDAERGGDQQRAVLVARRYDALAHAGLLAPPDSAWDGAVRAGEDRAALERRISAFRAELDRHDRTARTAGAAVRAARHELATTRSSALPAPETFLGWRFERLRGAGRLQRLAVTSFGLG